MQAQAVFLGGRLQGGQEKLAVLIVSEHRTALVPARGDMIEGARKLDAKRSCHCRFLACGLHCVNSQELTPFPLALLTYLGFRTLVLKQPWKKFCIAAAGYAAGWAAFLTYYLSRPWLYAQFLNHARTNVALTRDAPNHGIHKFLGYLAEIDLPTRAGTLVYLVALGGALFLLLSFWKSRHDLKEFLTREDPVIFTALAFLSTLFLAQFQFHQFYWATAWPFGVAVACQMIHRVAQRFPGRQRLIWGALAVLLALHCVYLPARTYLWRKNGFLNMRARLREFAATLPQGHQVFIPEVLWDTYAGGNEKVFMNSLPYSAGDPTQDRYGAYIGSLVQSGDVLVIDKLQSHLTRIDPHQPGWKEIGQCNVTYMGDKVHGFELTAYQKE